MDQEVIINSFYYCVCFSVITVSTLMKCKIVDNCINITSMNGSIRTSTNNMNTMNCAYDKHYDYMIDYVIMISKREHSIDIHVVTCN